MRISLKAKRGFDEYLQERFSSDVEATVEHIKDLENCFYCFKLCSFLHKIETKSSTYSSNNSKNKLFEIVCLRSFNFKMNFKFPNKFTQKSMCQKKLKKTSCFMCAWLFLNWISVAAIVFNMLVLSQNHRNFKTSPISNASNFEQERCIHLNECYTTIKMPW